MFLDDMDFHGIDGQNMLGHIDALPDQLANACALSQQLDLPEISGLDRVIICGMGGSAISGDLLTALVEETCPVPI